MVGAAFHHLSDVLCFFVHGHGPDDGARGWRAGHLDLDGACLGDLAVELLEQRGVLEKRREPLLSIAGGVEDAPPATLGFPCCSGGKAGLPSLPSVPWEC